MKPLSQTRQAIVEEFLTTFFYDDPDEDCLRVKHVDNKPMVDYLTQALNDYNEAVIRMVEGKEKDIKGLICPTCHDSHWSKDCEWKKYNQALDDIKEELDK